MGGHGQADRGWEGEMFRLLAENVLDYAIFVIGPDGRVLTWSNGAERLLGYREGEVVGRPVDLFFTPEDRAAGVPQKEREQALATGRGEDDRWHVRKGGTRFWSGGVMTPLRDEGGTLRGFAKIMRDRTEWKRAEDELRERNRLVSLTADVHAGLNRAVDLPAALRGCADALVRHLDAALARIWTLDEAGGVLELRASAGLYTHTDGPHERVPVGAYKIGLIAREKKPHLTNTVVGDARVHDQEWARRERLVAFAGYPLLAGDKLYGVMAVFARHPLSDGTLDTLAAVASGLALGIERIRAEEDAARMRRAAEESERRFRQLAEHVTDVFWVADPARSEILYVSPAYETVWGRTPRSLYDHPRSFLDAVHPDDRGRVVAAVGRQAGGEATAATYRVVRPDGSVRWVWDRGFPVRDEAGRVVRVAGVAEDVTERKRVEDSLRLLADASAALAAVVDYESTLQKVAGLAVPHFADWCAVDTVGEDGSVRRVAVAHADPAKVRLAHDLHRRYPPDPDAPHGLPKVLRTGRPDLMADIPDELVARAARDADHLRILRELGLKSYMCVPLRGRERLFGVVSFVSAESGRRYTADDLAFAEELARPASVAVENARLYAELREADRRKDEFLATLAHELRNPLAPITNAVQILGHRGSPDPEAARLREMIGRQVDQLARLVDDLLDLSRVGSGKIELRRDRVAVQAAVQQAVETSGPLIEAGRHRLTLDEGAETVYVEGDLARLSQVVSNLLNNAAKYTPEEGHIRLTVAREGGEVVVRVADNGLGIPAAVLPRVFDMFAQEDRSRGRSQGGLGIGLTLVKRLVELHGGTVEAHSEGEGRGSVFVVRLPLAAAEKGVAADGEDGPPAPAAPPRRVLVVDDNVDAADSLSVLLSLGGHDVRTAHDGRAAVEQVRLFRPEVVLLDIGMPGMDGYETAGAVRELQQGRGVFLVALTGWGQEEDRRRTERAGFDAHLVKPVDHAVLQRLLATLRAG